MSERFDSHDSLSTFPVVTDHPGPDALSGACPAIHDPWLYPVNSQDTADMQILPPTSLPAPFTLNILFSDARLPVRLMTLHVLLIPFASCRDCGVPPHPQIHDAILVSYGPRGNYSQQLKRLMLIKSELLKIHLKSID